LELIPISPSSDVDGVAYTPRDCTLIPFTTRELTPKIIFKFNFITHSPKMCKHRSSTATAAGTAGDYQAVAARLPLVWKA